MTPSIHFFTLQGLSCLKCVQELQQRLKAHQDVTFVKVSRHFAQVNGTVEIPDILEIVSQAGYQAQLVTTPDARLSLSGLRCQHCIKNATQLLEAVNGVEAAVVTLDSAQIYGQASIPALIDTLKQAGYSASACPLDPKEISLLSTASAFVPHPEVTEPVATSIQPQTDSTTDPSNEERESLTILLAGMSCASCVVKIQRALEQVPGVTQVNINFAQQIARVNGNSDPNTLIAAIRKAGYQGEIIEDDKKRRLHQQAMAEKNARQFRWQAILAIGSGVPLMGWGILGGSMTVTHENQLTWLVIGGITFIVMLLAGGHFYRNAWRSLLNGQTTMDTLVALGTAAAWLYSMFITLWPQLFPLTARHLYYETSVMIIGLINLGHSIEIGARQRSSKALERLLDLTPPTARIITEYGEQLLPLSEVKRGMTLLLTSGDQVPVDGTLLEGEVWIDESMLTGEAVGQHKKSPDPVFAGTVIQDGRALLRADTIGSHTTLTRIINLVRQAQNSKPQIGQLADHIAAIFVPIVVFVALFSGITWYLLGPQPQIVYALIVTTTVLIIACPCALGLATPMSIIAGIGRAAELGVLIRDADALQQASKLDTIVFDKTGTLTEGSPKVVAIETFNQASEVQVLQWAAALEQGSHHPLAKAIVERAGISSFPKVTQFKTHRGLGVSGEISSHCLLLGNLTLLEKQQIDTHLIYAQVLQQAQQGMTPVLLAVDGKVVALFSIHDPLRTDSPAILQRLRHQGYQLIMLTGDHPFTAQRIAQEAGVDQVIAGVLPEGKVNAIKSLQAQGKKVAMVGDGINDAPALAQADVGIAMGSGSDIAIETATMTLMRHGLSGILDALALSRATLANMKQNLLGAFLYNILGIPIAAGILYPLTGTLLNPVIAGAAMVLSSITVVSNANRLIRFKPKP